VNITIPVGLWHACLPLDGCEYDDTDESTFVVLHVKTDQRDHRRAELSCGIDHESDRLGFARAQTWAGLMRTKQLKLSWREFDEICPWVAPEEDEQSVDPTTPATDDSSEC